MREYDVPPMVNALVEMTKKQGPMVLEVWDCRQCKTENFEFHAFAETVECIVCGHRVASKVPLYLSIREQAVDDK